MDIEGLVRIQDSAESELEKFLKENTSYKLSKSGDKITLSNGSPENYSFMLILDGERIGKLSPRRGATSVKERVEMRKLVEDWNSKASNSLISQSEIDNFFTDLDKAYRKAVNDGEKLQHLVAYKHLNVNVVENREGFEWSFSVVGSNDISYGDSESYNDLIEDLQNEIDKVNQE